jgi:hypothetical protein
MFVFVFFLLQFFCLRSYPLVVAPFSIGNLPVTPASLIKDLSVQLKLPQTNYKIGIATWNLAEVYVLLKDCTFLKEFEFNQCDIIVLGLQECEDIRLRRKEGSRSKTLKLLIQKTFSTKSPSSYEILAVHTLGGMQLYCLVNKRAKDTISGTQIIEVPCGIGNVLSNKGGICLLLRTSNNKTLAFISAHLAAHPHKVPSFDCFSYFSLFLAGDQQKF